MATFVQENEYMSLEDAASHLKNLSGSSLNEVHSFIDSCNMLYTHVAPENHEQLLQIIKEKMHWMIKNLNLTSWDELRQLLKEAFTPPMSITKWQMMLISCIQLPNENVTMYADRFSTFQHFLNHASTFEKSAEVVDELSSFLNIQGISVFINGLKEPIKSYMKVHHPNTIECAIQLALAEENYHLPPSYIVHLRCFFCKGDGHLAKFCMMNPRLRVSCTFCNEFGHTRNNCIKKNVQSGDVVAFVPAASTKLEGVCSICYDKPIDAALYKCGHTCMCFNCASVQRGIDGSGNCPICRAPIADVLKIYK